MQAALRSKPRGVRPAGVPVFGSPSTLMSCALLLQVNATAEAFCRRKLLLKLEIVIKCL